MALGPDREQQARIALLQHHTSQMQGYKTNILTVAVVILTIFEVWLRIERGYRTPYLALIMSFALGATLAFGFAFAARALWYGQLVRSAISALRETQDDSKPLISQLNEDVTKDAERKAEEKGKARIDLIAKPLTRLGDHRKTDRLASAGLACGAIIFVIVFLSAPAFGLGQGYQQVPDSLLEALRWGWSLLGAFLVIVVVDRLRKPSLHIQYRDEPITQEKRRWVHVYVHNKPLPLITRNTANECRGRVTYTNLETGQRKAPVYTSWASMPTPESIEYDGSGRPVGHSLAASAVAARHVESIVPSAKAKGLDIAAKFDGETDAWIWAPESYYGYKKPEYQLVEGTWRVEVKIESPGADLAEDVFILVNRGDKASGLILMPLGRNPSRVNPV